MDTHLILTIQDARRIGALIEAVMRNARVGWLSEANSGDVLKGTLRAFVDENGMFPPDGTDVRDMRVWITTDFGEQFRPVLSILVQMEALEFALDYE